MDTPLLNEFWFCARRFFSTHFSSCVLDRFHDVIVAGTTAEVPTDSPTNLLLCWIRIFLEQFLGTHKHTRCAETAVQPVVLTEPFLEWMHRTRLG